MRIFDYIYYRWFRVYAKNDTDPSIYASAMVATYQMLTAINLILLGSIVFHFNRPDYRIIILPLAVILIGINWYRYEHEFDVKKLEFQWKNETNNKKRLPFFLLIGYLVITFSIP